MWSMIIVSPGWRSAIAAKAAPRPGASRLPIPRLRRLTCERRGEHGSEASNEGAAVHLFNDLIRAQ